jgi:hypothetical protein
MFTTPLCASGIGGETAQHVGKLHTDANGFSSAAGSSLSASVSGSTLSFTLGYSSPYSIFVMGQEFPQVATCSIDIPVTDGLKFIYFNDAGVISYASSFTSTLITDYCMVAVIYVDEHTGNIVLIGDERHGLSMSPATHAYLHTIYGTRLRSGANLTGFTIGSGTLAAHAQFTVAAGSIQDEDLVISRAESSTLPLIYKYGDASDWRIKDPDAFPFMYSGSTITSTISYTGLPAYNSYSAGSWSLAAVANNQYFLLHIFASNDTRYPYYAVLGESSYATVVAARTGATTEISSLSLESLPFAEFVAVATVIYKVTSTGTAANQAVVVTTDTGDNYVDWRETPLSPGAGTAFHTHTNDEIPTLLEEKVLKGYSEYATLVTSSGGVLTLDYEQGNTFYTTLCESLTSVSILNSPASAYVAPITLRVTQGAGAYSIAWPAAWLFAGGSAPTMTATSGSIDVYVIARMNSSYDLYVAGQDMKVVP